MSATLADGVKLCKFANQIRLRAVNSLFTPISDEVNNFQFILVLVKFSDFIVYPFDQIYELQHKSPIYTNSDQDLSKFDSDLGDLDQEISLNLDFFF